MLVLQVKYLLLNNLILKVELGTFFEGFSNVVGRKTIKYHGEYHTKLYHATEDPTTRALCLVFSLFHILVALIKPF